MRFAVWLIALAAWGQDLPKEMLAAHNAARAKVGVPALEWSDDLTRVAQQWADKLIAERRFDHRPKSKFGETMFEMRGGQTTPAKVVERWVSEAANFDEKSNKCKGVCGHYTQVVWRDTKQVGCAVSRGGAREVWVCEYTPPGNYVGRRPY
jgi:pathogenesis-related protein 1